MWITYLIPVVAIVGMLVYVFVAHSRVRRGIAEGQGPIMFHNGFAGYFESLQPEEYLIGVWQGLAYTGAQSGAAQAAGAALNYLSKHAVGISKYTPNVFVAVTSAGRVLIAEEYSEAGSRGNFKEARVWGPGTTALIGANALPGHNGPPPSNPFNPMVQLELAVLHGPDGTQYAAWLSPQSLEVTGQQRSIGAALPIAPAQAAGVWAHAMQTAAAGAQAAAST